MFRRPVSRVASHRGKARAMFMDSWVVGVNVYGRSPRRLIVRSCVIRCRSHSWMVDSRLLIHRLPGDGNNRAGKSRDSRIRGMPSRWGLENWSKKLRFMVRLMVWVW